MTEKYSRMVSSSTSILQYALFLLCLPIPTVMASPVSQALQRRNPCDGVNASPVLYHEYREQCPPKYTQNEKQECDHCSWQVNDCAAFCQVRTNFIYGVEQPFANTYCHGPQTCVISETHTRTVGLSLSISPQLQKALAVGITGGFTMSSADAFARTHSVNLPMGQCGYFTFVPVLKETCGTMTTEDFISYYPGFQISCNHDKRTNIQNYCQKQLWRNQDGTVDGETIFVYTDCSNRMPLPMEEQDPVYQKPGVALDRGVYEAYANAWGNIDRTVDADSLVSCGLGLQTEPTDIGNCTQALEFLLQEPGTEIPREREGRLLKATDTSTSCDIGVLYRSDWDDTCHYTYADVALAAYSVIDKCSDDASKAATGLGEFGSGNCKAYARVAGSV
ncbi:uncharacterized protein BDV17DRAFT_268993 [Aspergillus undulatus]|uniref:uncharacterized protein n=1 Tax=Aspergillus undulatus TaxID=1810928 RepID=UPI003CCE382B